jgi:hypothetical protein
MLAYLLDSFLAVLAIIDYIPICYKSDWPLFVRFVVFGEQNTVRLFTFCGPASPFALAGVQKLLSD